MLGETLATTRRSAKAAVGQRWWAGGVSAQLRCRQRPCSQEPRGGDGDPLRRGGGTGVRVVAAQAEERGARVACGGVPRVGGGRRLRPRGEARPPTRWRGGRACAVISVAVHEHRSSLAHPGRQIAITLDEGLSRGCQRGMRASWAGYASASRTRRSVTAGATSGTHGTSDMTALMASRARTSSSRVAK